MTLLFVTSSAGKLAEVRRILPMPVDNFDAELAEPQSVELVDVVAAKAREAYALAAGPVMVEDSGLFLTAWNGLPGALVKWFIERVGPVGICAMMAQFPDRSATARTLIGYCDGDLRLYEGTVHGRITTEPRGAAGFGFDSIFVPDGASRTFAEMTATEKDSYSMRQRALSQLAADEHALRAGQ